MAVTKIWPVRDNLKRLIGYAENPQKTANPDSALCEVLDYAADSEKTERSFYVTGINCFAESAFEQMSITKRRFGKEGGVVAHHAYQSFKPGEVTPEQCHEIGVKLAQKLWGDCFEVVVATHLNTDCCHNHFVISSVSFTDGHKFNGNRESYYRLREASDELCREYGLSVVESPATAKTPRKIFEDEKAGKPTLYSSIREDIQAAVLASFTRRNFIDTMKAMGYEFDVTHNGNVTIKAPGMKYPVRLDRLGEEYRLENIERKIYLGLYKRQPVRRTERHTIHARYRGTFKSMKKQTGIRALYYHFLYRMGIQPKERQHKPYSAEMRAEIRFLDRHMECMKLVWDNKLDTSEQLSEFIHRLGEEIETLSRARSRIDSRRKRCDDPEQKQKYSEQRSEFTQQIAALRRDLKNAEYIEAYREHIRELIRIEIEQRERLMPKNKQKNRNTGRRYDAR